MYGPARPDRNAGTAGVVVDEPDRASLTPAAMISTKLASLIDHAHRYYYPRLCHCFCGAPNDCGWGVGLFHFGNCNDAPSPFEILRNRFRDDIG